MHLLINIAVGLQGIPYKYGGNNPLEGFDCSGLAVYLLKSRGVLPNNYDATAQGLFERFSQDGSWNKKEAGSLVFYGNSSSNITHVGIMLDSRTIVEAAGGDSRTNSYEDAVRDDAYVRFRLYTYRKDLVAIVKPSYHALGYF